jgi:hypothetical protein
MLNTSGEGSGIKGEYARFVATDGAPAWSYQSVGAYQEPKLELLTGEVGDGVEPGWDRVVVEIDGLDTGVGGRGFCADCGSGGTVLMNDLKDRTGRSIPSSDEVDMLSCWNGDRIWSCRLRFML